MLKHPRPVFALLMTIGSMANGLCAADVLTVDAPGVVTVTGVDPTTAPASDQVRIGGGQIRIGQAGPAVGDQAVRGDDLRLTDARLANGGNADTVDGKHAADFILISQKGVAQGVATLDASGKVPLAQMPVGGSGIGIGGSGLDGDLVNTSPVISALGFYEFANVNLSSPRTFPFLSIVRVRGNLTLSNVLTLSPGHVTNADWYQWLDGRLCAPNNGVNVSGRTGGGGNGGAGGRSVTSATAGGAARNLTGFRRPWLSLPLFPGGASGGAPGGGAIVLLVAGDVVMTGGGEIRANGGVAANNGTGAGGGIILVCTGTVTNLTLRANGGHLDVGGFGGGGGGIVIAIATQFLGTTTLTAAAGASGHSAGAPGQTQQIIMTKEEISALFLR